MRHVLVLLSVLGTATAEAVAQASCSNPEGRVLLDPADPFGGGNNLNGDTVAFDLSDMIHGLQFLFVGGPPPCPLIVQGDCSDEIAELEEQVDRLEETLSSKEDELAQLRDELAAAQQTIEGLEARIVACCDDVEGPARFRFLNDLSCNGQSFAARFEACGTTVTDAFDAGRNSSACRDIEASPSCVFQASANTPCGPICLSDEIPIEEGHIYDFVLTFDTGRGSLVLLMFDRVGDCSIPFPSPGPATRTFTASCPRGAGADDDESFAGSGVW